MYVCMYVKATVGKEKAECPTARARAASTHPPIHPPDLARRLLSRPTNTNTNTSSRKTTCQTHKPPTVSYHAPRDIFSPTSSDLQGV